MSLLENLPVDIHTPNHQEEELVQVLFGDDTPKGQQDQCRHKNHESHSTGHAHPPKGSAMLRIFEEGLAIVALFLFFSSPYVTHHIKTIPFVSSEILEHTVKIILILIFFSIIKRHCL